ncbi:MAG: hypothetical protein WC856_18930 [Methylococcaceae bacterium]|jgi:hypothetical protein
MQGTQHKPKQMIEANISVLIGKTIAEVSAKLDSEKYNIRWGNTNLSFYNEKFIEAVYGEKIKKEYEEGLLNRSKVWQNCWDSILKNT